MSTIFINVVDSQTTSEIRRRPQIPLMFYQQQEMSETVPVTKFTKKAPTFGPGELTCGKQTSDNGRERKTDKRSPRLLHNYPGTTSVTVLNHNSLENILLGTSSTAALFAKE